VSVRELLGHRHFVLSLAFSPDSRVLASGSADGTIKLWDVAERGPGAAGADSAGRTLVGHTGPIVDLDFSADGQRLVSAGSHDDSARLWDVATGESRVVRHKCATFVARFVDGGRKVLSGRAELRLWSDEIPGDVEPLRRWIEQRTNARVTDATGTSADRK
jgi:WD40 repeat protein